MFMNGVDVMGQVLNLPCPRERKISVKVFSYILAMAVNNAYAVYQKVFTSLDYIGTNITLKSRFEFKQLFAYGLIKSNLTIRNINSNKNVVTYVHVIVPFVGLTTAGKAIHREGVGCYKRCGTACSDCYYVLGSDDDHHFHQAYHYGDLSADHMTRIKINYSFS